MLVSLFRRMRTKGRGERESRIKLETKILPTTLAWNSRIGARMICTATEAFVGLRVDTPNSYIHLFVIGVPGTSPTDIESSRHAGGQKRNTGRPKLWMKRQQEISTWCPTPKRFRVRDKGICCAMTREYSQLHLAWSEPILASFAINNVVF